MKDGVRPALAGSPLAMRCGAELAPVAPPDWLTLRAPQRVAEVDAVGARPWLSLHPPRLIARRAAAWHWLRPYRPRGGLTHVDGHAPAADNPTTAPQ